MKIFFSCIKYYKFIKIMLVIFKGEMAERFKAHAWKVCVPSQVPWVRIPLSPPKKIYGQKQHNFVLILILLKI